MCYIFLVSAYSLCVYHLIQNAHSCQFLQPPSCLPEEAQRAKCCKKIYLLILREEGCCYVIVTHTANHEHSCAEGHLMKFVKTSF